MSMLVPAGGFPFAVCGLASFAATVGYAYSRKRMAPRSVSEGSGSDHEPRDKPNEDIEKPPFPYTTTACGSSAPNPLDSDSEKVGSAIAPQSNAIAAVTEPLSGSLKRKREDDDLHTNIGYPHNLSSIYPNKRSRTPSSDSDSDEIPLTEEGYLLIASPSRPITAQQEDSTITSAPNDIPASSEIASEDAESKIDNVKQPAQPSSDDTSLATDKPLSASPECESLQSTTKTPSRPPTPPAQILPKPRGFAAFASAGSAFRTSVDGSSPPSTTEKPIWWSNGSRQSKQFENPLAAESHAKTTYTHSTGEEDEEVESELKGVKLFIKRGEKDFTDGIIGNIKLLSHKTKQEERLLFRRDPLWQVSMNVRLHPLVRCTYEVEGNALRLILKEPVEQENVPPEQWPQELVVYALKAGRAPKDDFREFAKALLANAHFKSKGS